MDYCNIAHFDPFWDSCPLLTNHHSSLIIKDGHSNWTGMITQDGVVWHESTVTMVCIGSHALNTNTWRKHAHVYIYIYKQHT